MTTLGRSAVFCLKYSDFFEAVEWEPNEAKQIFGHADEDEDKVWSMLDEVSKKGLIEMGSLLDKISEKVKECLESGRVKATPRGSRQHEYRIIDLIPIRPGRPPRKSLEVQIHWDTRFDKFEAPCIVPSLKIHPPSEELEGRMAEIIGNGNRSSLNKEWADGKGWIIFDPVPILPDNLQGWDDVPIKPIVDQCVAQYKRLTPKKLEELFELLR